MCLFLAYHALQFNLNIPLTTPSRATGAGGGTFLITYLDNDLLIGRAAPGIFILKRTATD